VSATVPEEKVKTSLGKKPPKQSALWTPSPRSLWTSALSGPFGARCCHQVHCMERLPSVGVRFLPLIGRWSSTGDRETPHCGHSSVDSTSTLPVQPPSGVGVLWFPRKPVPTPASLLWPPVCRPWGREGPLARTLVLPGSAGLVPGTPPESGRTPGLPCAAFFPGEELGTRQGRGPLSHG
jgi:hypothetical protein